MSDKTRHYLRNSLIREGDFLPEGIVRNAAVVEYSGRQFCGWQRQSHSPSVQQAVEGALSFVANESIIVVCAGRTDTGVHATQQIIHFDTAAVRSPHNWVQGANSRLPEGVRLRWAGPVDGTFHARFAALSRTYRYVILNDTVPSALFRGMVTWCKAPLDEVAMHQSAQSLLGERDFTSYRAAGCQSKTPYRNLRHISVSRSDSLVVIEVSANAFLHHMVRNIAGVLMAVGRGQQPASWPGRLLELRDRSIGEVTAPPDGLYLVRVEYPAVFSLPALPGGPLFIRD